MIVSHLSQLLGAQRMSMSELQRRTDIPYTSLHALYHGRSKQVGFNTLDRICSALGCGVGELLEHVAD